jgi:hypothetical protein
LEEEPMATWFSNWTDWGHLSFGSALVYLILVVGIEVVLEILALLCFTSEKAEAVIFFLFSAIGVAATIILLYFGTK